MYLCNQQNKLNKDQLFACMITLVPEVFVFCFFLPRREERGERREEREERREEREEKKEKREEGGERKPLVAGDANLTIMLQ